uniref:hypothetical protein n=1 Tax=Yoonia sp. TaxID=2212373 RepID=UPI0040475D90
MVVAVQIWNPDDWEMISLSLLQHRHGALNVHKIPAAHKGDFGLDFYCAKDAVAYQCYAVEEPIDIATRADRQKKKITRDLAKVIKNQTEISKLFIGSPVRHWILLSPLHDSKEVNLHCSKKTVDLRKVGCAALDASFEVGIHDQSSFPSDALAAGLASATNVRLSIPMPTQNELDTWSAGSTQLLTNATHKLIKRTGPDQVDEAVAETAKSFLQGNALMDALRGGAPDMHDKVMSAINSRARRLLFVGPQSGALPGTILGNELDTMVKTIREAAPSLSNENAEQIAYGVVSEWIMRCPLDFPDV